VIAARCEGVRPASRNQYNHFHGVETVFAQARQATSGAGDLQD
jgi:hypothetical protein